MKKIKDFISKFPPAVVLALSFLIVIVTGAILLYMPFSQVKYVPLIDCLFMSTTSTCVTGLVTVTPASSFTLFGQIVILLLIQIGGLGTMSFMAIILLLVKEKLSYKEKGLIKEALNKDNYHGISHFVISIVKYSFLIEFIGFILMLPVLYKGTLYSVFQTFFLSVSAFCNAGIDILGSNSLMNYADNFIINFVVTTLIILGGLGFTVWFDITRNLKLGIKLKQKAKRIFSNFKLHTKIVLLMTVTLIFVGTLCIFIFEYNNVLSNFNLLTKLGASYMNSVSLRTAGFATIDYSSIISPTKIIMIILMMVGASPGGTGGGLKTTTLFLMILAIKNAFEGNENAHIFNKHIHSSNIVRAFVICSLYVFISLISLMLMTSIESFSSLDIMFEIASAIGTVGNSVGITSSLSSISKFIIIVLMYIGRLGPITIGLALRSKLEKSNNSIKYPSEEILVG